MHALSTTSKVATVRIAYVCDHPIRMLDWDREASTDFSVPDLTQQATPT